MSNEPTQASVLQPAKSQSGFRFALALPLGQLVVCALILLPVRGYIFYELGIGHLPGASIPFLRDGPHLVWSVHGLDLAAAINFPVGIAQLPLDLLREDKKEWMPSIDFRVWRATTWPILGIPFWWVAGRGFDALFAARRKVVAPRITWFETVLGAVMTAGFAIIVCAFGGDEKKDPTIAVFAGGALVWTTLAGIILAARIAQWRIRRAERKLAAASLKTDVTAPSQAQ